jgi:beta-lactamase class A
MIGRRHFIGTAAMIASGLGPWATRARAEGNLAGLTESFARIEATRGGRLGVAVLDTANGQLVGHRQDERFPLCSTFKLLAAGAVLARVATGHDTLERRIRFSKQDVVAYSPMTETHIGGDGMTLAAICEAAITLSDNTAANLMLDTLGGPVGLTAYLRGLGDTVTRLDRRETTLNEARPSDTRDTTSPAAMVADVQALTLGSALPASGKAQLVDWLRGNKTGNARLRARLPQGWLVGDKTGTGDHHTSNDVGLLWPPNGAAPVLVAAYLTEGSADSATREAALADVGAAVVTAWMG